MEFLREDACPPRVSDVMERERAIIIGAGPAGLTAAYELLEKTNVTPIVYEATDYVGGLAMTANYKGNLIDMGGHRFFSKSDRVMQWWLNILPLQSQITETGLKLNITYQNRSRDVSVPHEGPDPDEVDRVMLIRPRLSRIYHDRKLFDYPLSLNAATIRNLGLSRMLRIGLSFTRSQVFPIRPEKSLEDFFINRFGRELYETFFRDYTEKVWGIPCTQIAPEWGAQRVKGLSLSKAIVHAVKTRLRKGVAADQKSAETSLIERFLYPKYGPGQMWETVAQIVKERGAELRLNHRVIGLEHSRGLMTSIQVRNELTGETTTEGASYFLSTMPVKVLIDAIGEGVPVEVAEVARGLMYRDFITVGVLLRQMKIADGIVPDNWIYIQEPDVKIGRLQVFNNWSPYLVADPDTVWVGCEYFCSEGDELESRTNDE